MMRPITGIIVHHSAGPDSATVAQIRAAHIRRGFSDVGYHLLIRNDPLSGWVVEPGRPLSIEGAHDLGQNAGTIGVCLLGSYSGERPVPGPAWALLMGLLAGLALRFKLQVMAIEGHGEKEAPGHGTACPGFSPVELRASVARCMMALRMGGVPLT